MATYREMVYMCLDELKALHDDAYYTEEHILFLLGRMRALLLLRKHAAAKAADIVPTSDYQTICLDLENADLLPGACGGKGWLRSTEKVPDMLGVGNTQAYPVSELIDEHVTFIPTERMPFVGYNKWLRNIIYAAIGNDKYLYVKGANPQFKYMEKMILRGVFEDTEAAAKLSCDASGEPEVCDVLDKEFPLEEGLQAACIEFVIQELTGSRYAPQDKKNNAEDDFGRFASPGSAPRVARASDAALAAKAEEAS